MSDLSYAVEREIARLVREQAPPWATPTPPPVRVIFRGTDPQVVAHRVGGRPDGFLVVRSTGAVYAARLDEWTDEVAFVTAATDTDAVLVFYQLRTPLEEV